ncbi:hypothetical protein [Proteus vulgaris]|uniref:tail fiber/spike domain-containing protein n=1 Tax=Proteus vulgaris TaxID=585 RepID=UPI0034E5B54F
MTVSTELSHEEYVGNGVTTDFDFRFRIFESRHLIVVVADEDGNETTLKNGTDYTIVGAGSYHGGKVVLNKPLARGWTILLERDLPVVQETDLRNQGKFFAEVHEDALDYLTMLIQKALGNFSLSLRKPTYLSNYYDAKGNRIANLAPPKVGTDAANKDYIDNSIKDIDSKTLRVKDKAIPALPSAEQRRNKQLGFDNEGYPQLLDPAETGSLGYVLVDSFEKGAEITTRYQALHWENNGEYYRWDGALPKIVPVDSTPESSGGIGVNAWMSIGDASLRSEINVVVRRFKSLGDIISNLNLKIGDRVSAENYYENGNSGELFFTVVPAGTGIEDGGKFINLHNGLQLKQNIKMPCDPRAWGAVGDGEISNATKDTKGLQGAINYGSVYVNDGKYFINKTTKITSNNGVNSSRGAVLHYINEVGECIYINDGNNEIADTEFRVRIIDGGKDRVNSWSVVCEKVTRSVIDFEIIPDTKEYANNYGSLSEDEKLDLKFGLHLAGISYTNSVISHIYEGTIRVDYSDNSIIWPCVVWSNNRRHSIVLNAASTLISEVQIVPGMDAGIYSELNDVTHTQVLNNYFDGNTRLVSVIPTGTPIKLKGNLRRSLINDNRFFISATESINISGSLQSSTINSNFFSNGDSADTGAGDIIINHSTGSSIVGNTFFRNSVAEKTGKARIKQPQAPITIKTSQEYDEPTIITGNGLQGNNFYADSSYPEVSSILTKNNHRRINNKGTFSSYYSDNQDLKCYKISLTKSQLDNLQTSELYTDSLYALGITGQPDLNSGYVKTTIVQDSANLKPQKYGKQEIMVEKNMSVYLRTMINGIWGQFRMM